MIRVFPHEHMFKTLLLHIYIKNTSSITVPMLTNSSAPNEGQNMVCFHKSPLKNELHRRIIKTIESYKLCLHCMLATGSNLAQQEGSHGIA